jgi:hypothetical protein
MKTKILAAMALISTSFTPLAMMTPAHATNPTAADELAVCNALYVDNQTDPSKWRATVTNEVVTDGASTQVEGSERNINYRPDTTSTFVYAGFLYATDPLTRTGGSVNMWGQSVFSQKIWDNTLFDIEADFTHTVTYSWTCHVEEYVTTTTGGGEGGGSGDNGNNNGNNEQNGGNGNGNNGCGNGDGGPNPDGNPNNPPGCNGGTTTSEWTFRADYSDNSQAGDDVDEGYSTIATDQQQAGHVDSVNYTETGLYTPPGVRTLACINPGKKGGTWTKKNGYTGANCTTTYFNTATTAYGTTFDTITGTLPSASLPSL